MFAEMYKIYGRVCVVCFILPSPPHFTLLPPFDSAVPVGNMLYLCETMNNVNLLSIVSLVKAYYHQFTTIWLNASRGKTYYYMKCKPRINHRNV